MTDLGKPYLLQALDALRAGDRRGAAALIKRELREGNTAAKNLPCVSQLATHIGEVELAIEATRRLASTGSIEAKVEYWGLLATYGRSEEALADMERQPAAVRNHPSVLHVRGTIATQFGRFEEAEKSFRQVLAQAPATLQTWFSLAMIKRFEAGDPDISAMERLEQQQGGSPQARASLHYALGKAAEDCGDIDRAFASYSKGAALRRPKGGFDGVRFAAAADTVIREFTADSLKRLVPSGAQGSRSLFVTGLPRSGTTLTEQMLFRHSEVEDGAELNLFPAALMPARGGLEGALAYQEKSAAPDPWGEIARDYAHLVGLRFRSSKRIVDKSLGQSLLIGRMLHALPDARMAWLRRSPEDVALSCFATCFTTGLPWTWSLTDIADAMRVEDSLFDHWRAVFPDRILVVPYEDLVSSPDAWSARLQQHFGLAAEQGETASGRPRAISTASVAQVHEPISTTRIGRSAAFKRHLEPFEQRYYG